MEMCTRAERKFLGSKMFDREQQFCQPQSVIRSIKNHCVLNKKIIFLTNNIIFSMKNIILSKQHRTFNGKQCKNPASLITDRVFFVRKSFVLSILFW